MDLVPTPDTVKRKLKFDYLKARNDPTFKSMDLLSVLLGHFLRPQIVIRDMIQDAANQIQRQYKLRYCMVGLKSLTDGLYYYEVNAGMRPMSWESQKTRKYKKEDFGLHTNAYNAAEVSKLTRVYLEEENPLGPTDLTVLNRPVLHGTKRKLDEDALEADFVDTLILGPGDDILGWIEYSGTVTGKFPDPVAIRNIEVAAGILAVALRSIGYAKM
jgi:hypothetical protein